MSFICLEAISVLSFDASFSLNRGLKMNYCLWILVLLGPISALNLNETSSKDLLKYVLNQGNVLDMVQLLRNDIDREFFAELKKQGWSEDQILTEFKDRSPREEDYLEQLIAYDPTTRFIFESIAAYFQKLGIERDVAIRILGSLTPIFGVPGVYPLSKECSDASWTYLANLILSENPQDPEIQFAISSKYAILKNHFAN